MSGCWCRRVASLLVFVLSIAAATRASALAIGLAWDGVLYSIDETASAPVGVALGDVGEQFNTLSADASGRLFAFNRIAQDVAGLYEIDPVAVSATLVQVLDFTHEAVLGTNIAAAAFGPDGQLYFTRVPSPLPYISDLWSLDLGTGAYERIGSNVLGAVAGLDFGPDGVLYGLETGQGQGNGNGLVRIDTATGLATDLDPLVGAPLAQTIAFDLEGNLFGARHDLFRLDPASGAVLSSWNIVPDADIRGLVFVPEPGTSVLIALGLAALARTRRRTQAS